MYQLCWGLVEQTGNKDTNANWGKKLSFLWRHNLISSYFAIGAFTVFQVREARHQLHWFQLAGPTTNNLSNVTHSEYPVLCFYGLESIKTCNHRQRGSIESCRDQWLVVPTWKSLLLSSYLPSFGSYANWCSSWKF